MKQFEEISKWLTYFIGSKPKKVTIPSNEQTELWKNLMIEEMEETIAAIKDNDEIEMIDGFIDMLFILGNLYHFTGMNFSLVESNFYEVLNSNYSKLCKSEDEANKSLENYIIKEKEGNTYSIKFVAPFWCIMRSDGKIMKSVFFNKPNIRA